MTDPVEVLTKVLLSVEVDCPYVGDWTEESILPVARDILAALEAHYTLLPKPPPITSAAPLSTGQVSKVTVPEPR
jgi:hypothetical protein